MGARARAAALAGGDEDHIGLGQSLADLRPALLGGLAAHLGVRAGPEAARQLFADVDGLVGIGHEQGLTVGIDRDELDAAHTGLHHAVHRIGAAAANADDLDDRQMLSARDIRHCCFLHTSCVSMLRFNRSSRTADGTPVRPFLRTAFMWGYCTR